MKKLIFVLSLWVVTGHLYAQEPAVQQTVEDLLESMGDNMSDDADIQEILDDLESFRQNPLLINSAQAGELLRLHLLSEVQVNNLLRFREKTGFIYSLYEMASIDGFTPDVLQKIEPFISFGLPENVRTKKSSNEIFVRSTRVIAPSGATDQSKYEGSPERYYLRLKHVSPGLEYGAVGEKDPGEAFFSQSNPHGFDYTSAYVNFRTGKGGSRLFAGDYSIRFGQGLVAWQGFSMGKSAETTQVFRSAPGIRSYSSTDENQFFRGLAGYFRSGRFTVSPFISRTQIDANLDTLEGKPYFGAFQTSGYHRTGSEIGGENSLGQLAGGGQVSYSSGRWSVGLSTVYTRFDAVMNRSDEPYNQFLPEGKDNLVGGIDWKGSVKNVFLFGEAAISGKSGRALLTGLMLKPASNAELTLVYRNINKNYFSFYSNAFAESSRINDETGAYLGMKIFPAPRWIIWGYADFFKYRWMKYTTAAPSSGAEFLAQVSYSPTRTTNIYLRFFQEDKEQRLISGALKYNGQQLINRIRLNFTSDAGEQFKLKSRLEFSFYSKQKSESGLLICQDVSFKPVEKLYALNGRLAYFKTDSYNSRLYAYENDVLYAFSVPALYGDGLRAYLNWQRRFGGNLTLWLKFAATHQFPKTDVEQTAGSSTKSEIKIQIRYQF